MKNILAIAACSISTIFIVPAAAAAFTLDFNEAPLSVSIENFYDGGTDSSGDTGPDYGVAFEPTFLTAIDPYAPNPSNAIEGLGIVNVAAGFTDGFSFYYSALDVAAVTLYDGINGTGNVVGTFFAYPVQPGCDIGKGYCLWAHVGMTFEGVVRSAGIFPGGDAYLDNMTFGSSVPAPEPATTALMGVGLIALFCKLASRKSVARVK